MKDAHRGPEQSAPFARPGRCVLNSSIDPCVPAHGPRVSAGVIISGPNCPQNTAKSHAAVICLEYDVSCSLLVGGAP